jgi:hypothetical protein
MITIPHHTIYYLGYPLGRFAGLKHRQRRLADLPRHPPTREADDDEHPLQRERRGCTRSGSRADWDSGMGIRGGGRRGHKLPTADCRGGGGGI